MDLIKAITELREHKKQLDQAIATLEALQNGTPVSLPSRRGRKEMSEEERKQVSERMARYWAARRRQKDRHSKEKASSADTGHSSATA